MRQVILDTETTGLEVGDGHRIIEIGCVEIVNRRLSDRRFHQYLWPEREIDEGAIAVHGITVEFLRGCPRFEDVVHELIDFVRGAELVIHNAAFDIAFLDQEIRIAEPGLGAMEEYCRIVDTLQIARQLHPGQRNSLDALCARYEIDNSRRERHGALLDAEILADVYLAMTGGQELLDLQTVSSTPAILDGGGLGPRPALITVAPTADELAAHAARLQAIQEASGGRCLWLSE